MVGFDDCAQDARLASNNDRTRARETLMPGLFLKFIQFSVAELAARKPKSYRSRASKNLKICWMARICWHRANLPAWLRLMVSALANRQC